jgi:hypothetical protein
MAGVVAVPDEKSVSCPVSGWLAFGTDTKRGPNNRCASSVLKEVDLIERRKCGSLKKKQGSSNDIIHT